MRAVVVYESMYGNTHLIAEAIGAGLREHGEVTVVPVEGANDAIASGADLVVVGGPTHAHGMSHASTRAGAIAAANKPGNPLTVDPDAPGPGLREWFDGLDPIAADGAAFDTRLDLAAAITGRASKGIARKLRHYGAHLIAEPESFFVTKQDHLEADEEERARKWGADLGIACSARRAAHAPSDAT
jgi:hypothetical protein